MAPRPSSRRSDGKLGLGMLFLVVFGLIAACSQAANRAQTPPAQIQSGDEGTPSRLE